MARQDEISSTEKLLELIRDKGGEALDHITTPSPKPDSTGTSAPISNVLRLKKTITIGVDIQPGRILLTAVDRLTDGGGELIDCRSIPLKARMAVDSPDFVQTLKAALLNFTRSYKAFEIWTAISSAEVETRMLIIPQMPVRQIPNAAKWAFRRETSLDDEKDVFDFHLLGQTFEDGVQKIQLLAYAVPRREIKDIQSSFQKSGFPLTGISVVTFAVQNFFKTGWLDPGGQNICSLFIGRDWSRIAIYSGGNLMLGRDIKAGAGSIVEGIIEHTSEGEAEPFMMPENMDSDALDQLPPERIAPLLAAKNLLNDFLFAPPGSQDVDNTHLFQMIRPPLERITRQVTMTVEHFAMHYDDAGIDNIYVGGDMAANPQVVRFIEEQLQIPVDTMDPFAPLDLADQQRMAPDSTAERGKYVPAIGMGLADNEYTPNFLFTQEHKDRLERIRKFNRVAYTAFAFLFTAVATIFFWQTQAISNLEQEVAPLRRMVNNVSPSLDRMMVTQLAGSSILKLKTRTTEVQRYFPPAVLTELVNRTPADIALVDLDVAFGTVDTSSISTASRKALINGFVASERGALETTLAQYMLNLKASPLLGKPEIKKQSLETVKKRTVLHFTAVVPFR